MFESINKPKTLLLLGNILLVFFLILFSNLKLIPLRPGDFVFFTFLALALALYRPGWCFLLFVGMLPLENIDIAPPQLGIAIRPYQFFGALTILAIVIRLISKKLFFKLAKPEWYDWLVVTLMLGGFLSIISAPDKIVSFKLAIIIGTFAALYYLVRNYIQSVEDIKRVIPFFLSSSVIVVLYGIWQNWRFLHNLPHFEVMAGRPNATFTEPDWLGIFLVLLTSVIYILIYQNSKFQNPNDKSSLNSKIQILNYVSLILTFILLVLTVSRSAWLGALVVYIIFVLIFFTDLRWKNWKWRQTCWLKLKIISSLAITVAIIYVFHLTNFQLFNRVESTGTGLQKITISCLPYDKVPYNIHITKLDDRWVCELPNEVSVEELNYCQCRHINLEEIGKERELGNTIREVYRKDPNVNFRSEIYRKSVAEIKNHPILGIGWGSIGDILGKDERGAVLNSSNIFLETWLGAGIIGFLSLLILLGYVLLISIKNYFRASNDLQKTIDLFIIVSWFAVVIPNLFNAGIFLGIFWMWLAAVQLKAE